MEKRIAGLLGAVATLGALGAAQAAPTADPNEALRASSFAELLEPIPNAATLLQAMDQAPSNAGTEHNVQLVQYYHHHHHRYWRRRYYHHHHHHHHHHHGWYRYY
jgi:hypothetical protein